MTDRHEAQPAAAAARRRRAAILVVPAALVLGAAAAWGLVSLWRDGPEWVARGLTSGLSLTCGLAALACLILLAGLASALWQAGRPARLERRSPRSSRQAGTAMIEFALVLPIALMLVLITIQSTLLMAGNLCVHYAAYCAARTAIVAIPDGPRQVDPSLPPEGEGQNLLDAFYCSATQGGSRKADRIWRAAVWAVLPISSSSQYVPHGDAGSLTSGLRSLWSNYGMDNPWWADDVLARKLRYAADYTAVDISPPAAGDKYAANEDITVTVRHTFHLSVPYASRILAMFEDQQGRGRTLDFGAGEYGTVVTASCTLTNEGVQDFVELEPFLGQ